MTEREKLIELTTEAVNKYAFITKENLADYLLSHGVTIPVRCAECKVCVKTKTDVVGTWN